MFVLNILDGVVVFMLAWTPEQRGKNNIACLGKHKGKINCHYSEIGYFKIR